MTEINVERVRRAAALFALGDEFGPCHILVADGNVDDNHLDFCLNEAGKPVSESERELIELLRTMPGRERVMAYMLDTYSSSSPSLDQAALLADQEIEEFGPVECVVDGTMGLSDEDVSTQNGLTIGEKAV